jgi:Mg2+/Co2+ transporter CorB
MKKNFSNVSRQQNIEFGLATILITAILAYWSGQNGFILAVIILSLITILIPFVLTPVTAIWYKFSHLPGMISSSVLLGLVFFFIVTPVGCVRRICRKDSLLLRQFKKNKGSVLVDKEHTYTKDDLIHTF